MKFRQKALEDHAVIVRKIVQKRKIKVHAAAARMRKRAAERGELRKGGMGGLVYIERTRFPEYGLRGAVKPGQPRELFRKRGGDAVFRTERRELMRVFCADAGGKLFDLADADDSGAGRFLQEALRQGRRGKHP